MVYVTRLFSLISSVFLVAALLFAGGDASCKSDADCKAPNRCHHYGQGNSYQTYCSVEPKPDAELNQKISE